MTPAHCETQLKRLTVLRGMPEEIVEYFAALEDVPEDLFTRAIGHALKTRMWFPTPAELRADCDAAQGPVSAPALVEPTVKELVGGGRDLVLTNPFTKATVRIHVTREWKFDCDDCADSGWREQQCPSVACGRRKEHAPHIWVERCFCLEWNPTIRRRNEAGMKYAKSPEKVGS